MPRTIKGKKTMAALKKEYGAKKGEEIFYRMENKRKGLVKGKHK